MRNKRKTLRNNHIWFSLWNTKNLQEAPKCDATYRPTRVSSK